jgi:hypothetical protein
VLSVIEITFPSHSAQILPAPPSTFSMMAVGDQDVEMRVLGTRVRRAGQHVG